MNKTPKLPIGVENFEEIRTEDFYYVDKTGLIRDLLDNWGKVTLFTRPRRFGKSLNMSMLKYFFGYGCDNRLFEGLSISRHPELCEKYMGEFPVISITLKDVNARNFETARGMLCSVIGNEAMQYPFLAESEKLSADERAGYRRLVTLGEGNQPMFIMSDEILAGSLRLLTHLLCKHYSQKVILLIDEYDVPLDKAQHSGFYDEMVTLIRNLLGQVLKSNDNLFFAVLTGCLRIAHESIFTGLNNLQIFSITNTQFDEHFGFSDREVMEMLEFYNVSHRYDLVKKWYDGYRFGDTDVYCPWDVINYCAALRANPKALPQAYWLNTSGNDIIRRFIRMAGPNTKREIEYLINNRSIKKKIKQELTYRDLYQNIDNLWSVLFATGYLTLRKENEPESETDNTISNIYSLAIPNLEVRKIFIDQIMEWFQEEARRDTSKLDSFCAAFAHADAETVEELFNAYLRKTISIRDTGAKKGQKENFYHGILLGLLSHYEDWFISSNAESGNGFSDILIELEEQGIGIVIEIKYPDNGNLERGCHDALAQIEQMDYEAKLRQNDLTTIYKYGIACYKKQCKVLLQK